MKLIIILLLSVLIISFLGCTTTDNNSDINKQNTQQELQSSQQGPPQEAIDACMEKNPNDSCIISTPQGQLEGNCINTQEEVFACIPNSLPTSQTPSNDNTDNPQVEDNEPVEEVTLGEVKIPDTMQENCYNNSKVISCGSSFIGQDAQHSINPTSYTDNGDGTITDNITGLMWQKDKGEKEYYYDAINNVENFSLAGYDDWRVPSIKELYSLMDFRGLDPSGIGANANTPFINTNYFIFEYGDETIERSIDSQWVTSSIYVGRVMNNEECFFGVNFADGRIKCYPTNGINDKKYFVIYVRGPSYGVNNFVDNKDQTITDNVTDLMWMKNDSKEGMDWESALNYCENLKLANYQDWSLPNAKELEYIVDYTRSPDTTDSAAINEIFNISEIVNEKGQKDYPYFWTSTTHANEVAGSYAAYISFGRALGNMNGMWMDVHGAGAQRSDPKTGSASDFPTGHGPQGDAIRINNYVRCVRN